MAGKGFPPKDPNIRQRRNRKSTAAGLVAPEKPIKQPLPKGRKWHALTRAWWARVWSSPMAGEYLDTDADGLGRVAVLVDHFYQAESPSLQKELMTEIRLQEARFGLSPADRGRLYWEIQKGEVAEQKRKRAKIPERLADPRSAIKAVS